MTDFDYPKFIELIDRCKCDDCQAEKQRIISKYEGIKEADEKRKSEIKARHGEQ